MSPDIAARIQRDFSSSAARREAHVAVASLEVAVKELGLEHAAKELDRITRCVLYLADGNLENLASYTKAAMQDYRDVI
jgi:hypothetical protein